MAAPQTIDLASEGGCCGSSCCGACPTKKYKIEALFITADGVNCCGTNQIVVPMASIDHIYLDKPNCRAYLCKCLMLGTVIRNGKIRCCDCGCSKV